jgi:hypothetical protein
MKAIHTHEVRTTVTQNVASRLQLAAARKRRDDEEIIRRAIDLGLPHIEAEIEAPTAEVSRCR